MENGSRYYRALEIVSIASALSTVLTIYPCQIRVHQRWQSKLQLPTARKKEWRPATAYSSPQAVTCQHCDTHTNLVGLEPATFQFRPTRYQCHRLSSGDKWQLSCRRDLHCMNDRNCWEQILDDSHLVTYLLTCLLTHSLTHSLILSRLGCEFDVAQTLVVKCRLSACRQLFFSVKRPENSRCSASRCVNCCSSAVSSMFDCSSSSTRRSADDSRELVLVTASQ